MDCVNPLCDEGSSPVSRRDSESPDARTSVADKQRNQSDALRKLMGESNVYVPPPSAVAGGEPVSLASFMGGRATGPKLTRHAPQQDAHDPTQFDQRSVQDIRAAPHPIFGSRGVVMPGMAGRGAEKKDVQDRVEKVEREELKPWTREKSRERTISSPSTAPLKTEQSFTAGSEFPRARTESVGAPSRVSSSGSTSTRPPVAPAKPISLRQSSQGSEKSDFTTRSSYSPSVSRPKTPPASTGSPSPRTTYNSSPAPGLARPIQPQNRTPSAASSPASAIASASKNASPAFLRPPPQKDLTPSLSRLQGRGFVQSFVKLSSELEAASTPGNNTTPERGSPAISPSKKPSVLDRWQPQASSPQSPSAPPLRKTKTLDSSLSSAPRSGQPSPTSPTPFSKPKEPTKSTSLPEKALFPAKSTFSTKPLKSGDARPLPSPALGSSNTLFSYIKPTKTGDNPPTNNEAHQEDIVAGSGVDELGMRTRPRTKSQSFIPSAGQDRVRTKSEAAMPAPTGRPLSHVRHFW